MRKKALDLLHLDTEAEAVNVSVWRVGYLICVCVCFFPPSLSVLQDLVMPWGRGDAALSAHHKVCAKPLDSNAPN